MAHTVRDVMTAPPKTLPSSASLRDAAVMMRDEGIGSVVVAEGRTLVGIVTDRDIVVRCVAGGGDPAAENVRDTGSELVVHVGPDAGLDEAARLMREYALRRLPVVDGDTLVGVVALGDLDGR